MAEIICLANSRKHRNRCIAGLERASRQLIRPVSTLCDGAITVEMQRVSGRDACLLDVLEVPLAETGPDYGFQPENRSLTQGFWKKVGRVEPRDLVEYCEGNPVVLHNGDDRASWQFLQGLARPQWKSLQLIRVEGIRFYLTTSFRGHPQVRANFVCCGSRPYDLVVTDMITESRVKNGNAPSSSCILLVSLGGPYPEDDPDPQCYKLVAGVIELPE